MSSTKKFTLLAGFVLCLYSDVAAQFTTTPALAGGDRHSVVLKPDGTLLSWGWNGNGQLGIGSITPHTTPQPIPATQLNNVIAVDANTNFSLALKADGSVWGWGCNFAGQLGLGDTTERHTPHQISPAILSGVTAIAAGDQFAIALKSDGAVMSWGANMFGQLGLGDSIPRLIPTLIPAPALSGVIAIDAGCNHAAALLTNGTVRVWGSNAWAQLGLGDTLDRLAPVSLPLPAGEWAASIATGGFTTTVITPDHTIISAGINNCGQLGLGNTGTYLSPQIIAGSNSFASSKLFAGEHHTFGVTASGQLFGWGANWHGQLGIGDVLLRTAPALVPVSLVQDILVLASGQNHGLAICADGSLRAWGKNYNGQLGTGDQSNRVFPTVIIPNFVPAQFSLQLLTAPGQIRIQRKNGPAFHAVVNMFTLESQTTPSSTAISMLGLYIQPAEFMAWQTWALAGHPLAVGFLDASGFSEFTLYQDPGLLAGLTVHGIAWAINVSTGSVTSTTPLITHQF